MSIRTFISPSNVPIYDDGAGNQAVIHTEWMTLPSGLLVAQRVDNGGIPLSTSRITTELTDAVLAANGSYIQGWQDAQGLAVNFVSGSVYADQAGTLYVDFSEDGTNVYGTSATTLAFTPTTASTANGATLPYPVEIPTRYFRFRYVNGTTAQGVFQLYQTPVSQWSPRMVGLTGQLALLPYLGTVPIVSSAITLAASASYSSPPQNWLGYRQIAAIGNVSPSSATPVFYLVWHDGIHTGIEYGNTDPASQSTGYPTTPWVTQYTESTQLVIGNPSTSATMSINWANVEVN